LVFGRENACLGERLEKTMSDERGKERKSLGQINQRKKAYLK